MSVDFRECLYALSDVIINRPRPLRAFDQIYMKLPDMLLQAELLSRWFDGKRVVFVGDGDAIGLSLAHLSAQALLPGKPENALVLDFDERVVNSINHFGEEYAVRSRISASLYNVADPLPPQYWAAFDAFYTNPPWGASNNGRSVSAFIQRGIEAVGSNALGCIVLGDHRGYPWTHDIQMHAQSTLLEHGFRVAEMIPQFHKYHLDDAPDLTSCSLVVERRGAAESPPYRSMQLSDEQRRNFYGAENPLKIRYIRDLTNGGKLLTHDVRMEPF